MNNVSLPKIIQGGMGVNISSWRLARTVSSLGQQGTVSGVALERIAVRILQNGDLGGHLRRALATFPFRDFADKVVSEYYVEGGIPRDVAYRGAPMFSVSPSKQLAALTVCANYAFVWLAKEGHQNPVSINYLEKLAMPHVFAIYGAMLAGVDCITMGAGIPLQIPALLEAYVLGQPGTYRVPVTGASVTSHMMSFDPKALFGEKLPELRKPRFLPIIASNLLAEIFKKKLPEGSVSGFVVEEPTAGGHNAPPRKIVRDANEIPLPVYGSKDFVAYKRLVDLGIPFWIGGSYASPEKLVFANSIGAVGIQAGSVFALCEESDMDPEIRQLARRMGYDGSLLIRTDMRISPTGFPFKVACLPGTMAEADVYENRPRICDHGALVDLYERPDGSIGYRCASEPVEKFVAKGGVAADSTGRGCLCNGLLAAVGLQTHGEAPLVTLGDDVGFLRKLMKDRDAAYTAQDAIRWLLGQM